MLGEPRMLFRKSLDRIVDLVGHQVLAEPAVLGMRIFEGLALERTLYFMANCRRMRRFGALSSFLGQSFRQWVAHLRDVAWEQRSGDCGCGQP